MPVCVRRVANQTLFSCDSPKPSSRHFPNEADSKAASQAFDAYDLIIAPAVDEGSLLFLQKQEWPGNIRQLKNALERAVVMSDGGVLDTADFLITPPAGADGRSGAVTADETLSTDGGLNAALESLEKRMILAALAESGGIKSRAAEILKIPRTQLLYRMKKLGMGED